MNPQPPTAPTVDIPLSAAVEELTGFEVIAIEKRFGKPLENMGAMTVLMGTVWAMENRGEAKRSWQSVEHMTIADMTNYFAPEPVEPDSDVGKGL